MANLLPFRALLRSCSSMALIMFWSVISIIVCASFMHSNLDTIAEGVKTEKIPDGVYHSEEVFRIDYAEMEKKFKIYVYPHEDESTYYDTTVGMYASEGYFFKNIRESLFLTRNPHQAHFFFIPISLQKLHQKVSSYKKMASIARKYVKSLIREYPYWNRTMGADHFFLTCLDHPLIDVPMLVKNTIRVVCSSTYNSDAAQFIPHKDVVLPSVMQPFSQPASTGNDMHKRTTLGYWAGVPSSNTRKMLVNLWGLDDELDIQNTTVSMGGGRRMAKFYSAKFCICPVGSRITNSRITMAIHYGCVPVILEDYLDLPFNDIVDWREFSVVVKEDDVYRLKGVLNAKAGVDYRRMYRNLIKVQKHFQWNTKPVKYDAFHMIMYDLWLRRHVVIY